MSNGNKKLNLFFSNNIFLGSFNNIRTMPNENLPECCFVGRSNVGKSSIINSITKTKKLAKTSKTPGRTQSINLFKIDKKINLVDLPGYGYAKVSKKLNSKLINLIESYILERKNLIEIYILIDCKVGIKNSDIDLFDFLLSLEKKFSIIITKTDKCSIKFIDNQSNYIKTHMKNYKKIFNKIFITSNKDNKGILDVQKDIFNLTLK
ncbi:MAG: putative GTP-binding protein EngB [Alphaproteobacteria bacterium MarineAlpha5_Bin6]|nr:MAG: putative GTP-binding protein EngB [Alphaproteobacteria bacterium MarineAlpha5_Bin6]